jgi:hypothetical protein
MWPARSPRPRRAVLSRPEGWSIGDGGSGPGAVPYLPVVCCFSLWGFGSGMVAAVAEIFALRGVQVGGVGIAAVNAEDAVVVSGPEVAVDGSRSCAFEASASGRCCRWPRGRCGCRAGLRSGSALVPPASVRETWSAMQIHICRGLEYIGKWAQCSTRWLWPLASPAAPAKETLSSFEVSYHSAHDEESGLTAGHV